MAPRRVKPDKKGTKFILFRWLIQIITSRQPTERKLEVRKRPAIATSWRESCNNSLVLAQMANITYSENHGDNAWSKIPWPLSMACLQCLALDVTVTNIYYNGYQSNWASLTLLLSRIGLMTPSVSNPTFLLHREGPTKGGGNRDLVQCLVVFQTPKLKPRECILWMESWISTEHGAYLVEFILEMVKSGPVRGQTAQRLTTNH